MNYFAIRRQALIRNLKKLDSGFDAVLITCPVNVTYLTGFTGESSYVIVTPKNSILVSDHRFEVQIHEECLEIGKGPELELHIRPHNKTTSDGAAEVLTKLGAKSVAVEGNRIAISDLEYIRAQAPKATFVPQDGMVEAPPRESSRLRSCP